MSGTHFKGPVQFSNQTPALQNLNIGNWPDQVYYMDDFLDHVSEYRRSSRKLLELNKLN